MHASLIVFLKVLEAWIGIGMTVGTVMALGFWRGHGVLTLLHKLHVAVVLIAWPVMLVSTGLAMLGKPEASRRLERIAFGWIHEFCFRREWTKVQRMERERRERERRLAVHEDDERDDR